MEADATRASDPGTLSVINIPEAEQNPANAVIAAVPAGCRPVRVAVSPNGATVFVTARESDELLAFSAAKLADDPSDALLGAARVGEAPVGLAPVDNGRLVVVADSNRFNAKGAHSGLTIVDTAKLLTNRPAILGTIAAHRFPREMALEPNGRTLLVNNAKSSQLEAVAVDEISTPNQ